jgi:antitoxin component of MazEF toxin-antitoxin module
MSYDIFKKRVRKVGGSLMAPIPNKLVKQSGFYEDAPISIHLINTKSILIKLDEGEEDNTVNKQFRKRKVG